MDRDALGTKNLQGEVQDDEDRMTTCLSLKTFKHNRLGYFCRVCRSYTCRKSLKKTKPRNYAFE